MKVKISMTYRDVPYSIELEQAEVHMLKVKTFNKLIKEIHEFIDAIKLKQKFTPIKENKKDTIELTHDQIDRISKEAFRSGQDTERMFRFHISK